MIKRLLVYGVFYIVVIFGVGWIVVIIEAWVEESDANGKPGK